MEENNYLGQKRVGKLLLQFAVPSTLALIISCLYNIVDQIFVGNGIGYLGNAATGIIFPITVVGWGASVLFGDGMATFLSLSQGKGDTSGAGRSVANSILGSFFSGVAIIAVCYGLGDDILYALGATEATIGLTRDYGNIIFIMMPLALVQNTLASIIRADGAPRYSMAAMMVGAVINMIGDPVAIFLLGWGIKGAAFATILGQFVSFLICAAYLGRSRVFKVKASDFIPSWEHLKPVLPLGCGSFLTQLCIVATTIVNNVLLKSYGAKSSFGPDIPLSAFVVIMKLFQIILNIACGITAGALPIIIHAPKDHRVKKVMEMYGDTEQEGKKSIARSDAARSAYYMSISGQEWGDPHQYELSIDSSLGAEKTADLICAYMSYRGPVTCG